jgi:formate hydrogenlyase transcriptional activator
MAIRDISEKATQAALEQSEQRFQLFLGSVRDYAIFQLDPEGHVRTWNDAAQRMKGYSAEEIVGQHFSRFYTAEDVAGKKPELELKAAAEAGRSEDEGWRVRKDGSRFWAHVTITAIRDRSGTLLGFAKITRDETERRNAQEALRRSEEHARMLFELSPDAVLVCDAEGRIREANARVETLFGYRREELAGQTVELLVPDRFRGTHSKHRQNYVREPRLRPMGVGLELYGRHKEGGEFPVDILLGPVERPEGRIIFVVVRDLSERQRYEEALRRSQEEKRYLEEELTTTHQFEEIIGEGSGLKRVLKQVETVAATDATVLILGETGTGKELIARAIHELSPRRDRPFVKLNCSAIPSGLLESELFGHEKGAFTGAISQKIGRLELAHQGTFFLDEVGDLPLELQPKILRALQEKEFERVGGTRTIPVNVRLVAATNRDLAKMVNEGQFRSDLYYRLRVFPLEIPPLRERREDIPLLVRYFVTNHSKRMGRHIETIPAGTMEALKKWHWPGNVRELENFIERSVILTQGSVLRAPLSELAMPEEAVETQHANLEAAEREHILRVLREAKGMIGGPGGAAERLGLKRTTLNSKMKKLGIKRRDYI